MASERPTEITENRKVREYGLTKRIVAYPYPPDVQALEKVYAEQHVPMAVAKLTRKTNIVATKILA
jgi:hypothetical protein